MQRIKIIFIIKWATTQTATTKIATITAVMLMAFARLISTHAGTTIKPKQAPEPSLELLLVQSSE